MNVSHVALCPSVFGAATPTSLQTAEAPVPQNTPSILNDVEMGHFVNELDFVNSMLSGTTIFLLALALLLSVVLFMVLSRLSAQWTRRHRLTSLNVPAFRLAVTVSLLIFALAAIFRFFLDHIPVLATVTAVAGTAAIVFAALYRLIPWMGGLSLLLQRKISSGDMVHVGEHKGTVDKIGLFRLALLDADGARLYVRVAALGGGTVAVSTPGKSHLVDCEFRASGNLPFSADVIEQFRLRAVFCPYRLVNSSVDMECPVDTPHLLRIRFRTWSRDAAILAKSFLAQQ